MATMTRYISTVGKDGKENKKTINHKAALESKGFEVEEKDGMLEIQATEVVEGVVDLSTPEKANEVLTDMLAQHKVFSYQTEFIFADREGKPNLHGTFALSKLGKVSCLVTKGEAKEKVTAVSGLDSIFSAL